MHNTTMYCHSLHDKMLSVIQKVGYVPVGLGDGKFSEEWLKDDTTGFGKMFYQKLKTIIGLDSALIESYGAIKNKLQKTPNSQMLF